MVRLLLLMNKRSVQEGCEVWVVWQVVIPVLYNHAS